MIRVRSNFHFVAEESMNFLLAICFKDKTVYYIKCSLTHILYYVYIHE